MKYSQYIYLFLTAVFLLSACAPGLTTSPTAASSLPDLAVSGVYLGMQDVPTNWVGCIPAYGPLEIRALIQNTGQVTAYNITVIELSSGTNLTIGELEAGQGMEVYFPIATANAAYNVVVDPQNTIIESDEGNNSHSYFAITPTPPALCTPITTTSFILVARRISTGGDFSSSTNQYHGVDYVN